MDDHHKDAGLGMSRKEFVALAVGGLAGVLGSAKALASSGSGLQAGQLIDAGPASAFAANTVYDKFRCEGFFVIRRNGTLCALSSICTHRQCKLIAEPDHSFSCPCHGSTFDPSGKVTQGPAKRDLPVLSTLTNEKGHVLVKISPDR